MSFIKRFLGLSSPEDAGRPDPRSVGSMMARLDDLDPQRARYLAAFAYVLARAAYADSTVCDAEEAEMRTILKEVGALPDAQAELVVEMAAEQARQFGGTQDFVVTRLLAEMASLDQRKQVLACILEVTAADGLVTGDEEQVTRLIARQLGFRDVEFLEALSHHRDKRSVLQGMPKSTDQGPSQR